MRQIFEFQMVDLLLVQGKSMVLEETMAVMLVST
jgi:hypothetical protein